MKKTYPLHVENWGDDHYMLVSKGHHDIAEFKEKSLEEYESIAESLTHSECPCEHLWYKRIPQKDGYTAYNVPVPEGTRGCFPATVWWE